MGQRDNHGTQHPVGTGKLDVHRACQKNTSTIRGWQTVIAWCTGKGLIDTSAGSARPMAKGDQLFVNDVNIPAKPDGHPHDRLRGVHLYAHGARSWMGSGPVTEDVNTR